MKYWHLLEIIRQYWYKIFLQYWQSVWANVSVLINTSSIYQYIICYTFPKYKHFNTDVIFVLCKPQNEIQYDRKPITTNGLTETIQIFIKKYTKQKFLYRVIKIYLYQLCNASSGAQRFHIYFIVSKKQFTLNFFQKFLLSFNLKIPLQQNFTVANLYLRLHKDNSNGKRLYTKF